MKITVKTVALVLLSAAVAAGPAAWAGTMIGPMWSATIPVPGDCEGWHADLYATAVPLPEAEVNRLEGGDKFFVLNKVSNRGLNNKPYWEVVEFEKVRLSGTPEEKLRQINKWAFGTENPAVGVRNKTATMVKAQGVECVAPPAFECIGASVHSGDNAIYPIGPTAEVQNGWPGGPGCARIPNNGQATCSFDVPDLTLSMGTVPAEGSAVKGVIPVTCTGDVTYRFLLLSGGTKISNEDVTVALTADGTALPASLALKVGKQSISIAAAAQPKPGATGDFTLSTTLIASPQ